MFKNLQTRTINIHNLIIFNCVNNRKEVFIMKTLGIAMILICIIACMSFLTSDEISNSCFESSISDSVIIQKYENGMPKIASYYFNDTLFVKINWYASGVIESREIYSNNCPEPYFIEEWYENGIKSIETYYNGCQDNNFKNLTVFSEYDQFRDHVYSGEWTDEVIMPAKDRMKDTIILIGGIVYNPIRSWYPSGQIKHKCVSVDTLGALVEEYDSLGNLSATGHVHLGVRRDDWQYYE